MSRCFVSAFGLSVVVGVPLIALTAPGAQAAPFTNGGFELGAFDDASANGHVMSLQVGSTVMTGWTTTTAELAWARNDNPFVGAAATNGNFFLDLTGFHDGVPFGGVTQTVDTVAGNTYTLGFDIITFEGDFRYRGPASVTASAGGNSQTFTFASLLPFVGVQSGHFTLPFVATGSTTTITLQGTLSTGGQFLGLDNVTLVPEPASLAAAALGGAGFMLRRRRRH
jgi:hypothetical protein